MSELQNTTEKDYGIYMSKGESENTNEHLRRWFGLYNGVRPAVAYAYIRLGTGCRCMEIGVQEGSHSRIICEVMKPSNMICVDPWIDIDWSYKGQIYHAKNFEVAVDRLKDYNVTFMRGKSQEELLKIPDNSLDFVYIDGDHSKEVCEKDIRQSLRIVRLYGVVGGHDYESKPEIVKRSSVNNICVYGAVANIFDGHFVDALGSDWWVVVTPELKQLGYTT